MSIHLQYASNSFVLLSIVAAGLLAPGPMAAQPESFESSVSGVVSWEGGGSINGFQVELNDRSGRQSAWADVRPDGTFEIHAPRAAGYQYIIRVRDRRGQIVHNDIVQTQVSPLEIHLRAPEQQRPVTGVVSAEDLLNKIPRKALREFQRAQKAVQKGEIPRAIRHLRKAIQIHPQFVEAQCELSVLGR